MCKKVYLVKLVNGEVLKVFSNKEYAEEYSRLWNNNEGKHDLTSYVDEWDVEGV